MNFWVKLLFRRDSSVRIACPSIMLAAPRVDQFSWVSKVPLLIPISGVEVSGAVKTPSLSPSLTPSLLKKLSICRFNSDGNLRTPGLKVVFIRSWGWAIESRWLPSGDNVAVKLSVTKVFLPLMVWMWRSNSLYPEMKPARCPSSWRIVVRRSYFPWASESAVARSAVSVRVCENSLWSKGVGSMNQPSPLALWSMRIFPPLGIPWGV